MGEYLRTVFRLMLYQQESVGKSINVNGYSKPVVQDTLSFAPHGNRCTRDITHSARQVQFHFIEPTHRTIIGSCISVTFATFMQIPQCVLFTSPSFCFIMYLVSHENMCIEIRLSRLSRLYLCIQLHTDTHNPPSATATTVKETLI